MTFLVQRVLVIAFLLSFLAACVCLAVGKQAWAWGILFGVGVGNLNFWLLKVGLTKATREEAPKRAKAIFFRFILRYAILAVALFIAFQKPELNVFGFLAGIISVHLALLIVSVWGIYSS